MKLVFDTTEIKTLISRSGITLIECANDDAFAMLLDMTHKYQCSNILNSEDKVIAIANAPFEIIIGHVIDSGDKDCNDDWHKWFTKDQWEEFIDRNKTRIETCQTTALTNIELIFDETHAEVDELETHPDNSSYVIKHHVAELIQQCQRNVEDTVRVQFNISKSNID